MQASIFIARIIGPITLVVGLALAFNAAAYRVMVDEFLRSHALIFLAGILTLATGLAIVLVHNIWTADWRVIITILGWLFVIAGAARTAAPQVVAAVGRSLVAKPLTLKIGAAIDLVLGALLCFFGFFY